MIFTSIMRCLILNYHSDLIKLWFTYYYHHQFVVILRYFKFKMADLKRVMSRSNNQSQFEVAGFQLPKQYSSYSNDPTSQNNYYTIILYSLLYCVFKRLCLYPLPYIVIEHYGKNFYFLRNCLWELLTALWFIIMR